MKRRDFSHIAAVLFTLSLTIAATAAAADKTTKPKLQAAELGATRNVHSFGPTLLCGQPDLAALEQAKKRGIKVVVSLREPGEVDADEAAAAKSVGLEFHRIAFLAPETLDDKVFASVRKILADSGKSPVLLYCGSANRVGAIWAAHRALDGGLSVEDAMKEGKAVGLKSPDYEKIVEEYIQRNKK